MIFVFSGLPNKEIERICNKYPSFISGSYSELLDNYSQLMVIYNSIEIINIRFSKFYKNTYLCICLFCFCMKLIIVQIQCKSNCLSGRRDRFISYYNLFIIKK